MKKNDHRDIIAQYVMENSASFYRIAFSYARNHDNALDIVQEAAYKALKSSASLREPQYIKTWFHRILINTAIDNLRKSQRYQLTDDETTFEAPIHDHYENLDLKSAMTLLSDEQRLGVILRYFEDMRLQDIADMLGENLSTVKTRLYAALKKLRIEIQSDEERMTYE